MSIIQGNAHTSAGGGGFQIERSLRFNSADSASLTRTFGTPTSRTTWTMNLWFKRSTLSTTQYIFHSRDAGNTVSFECLLNTTDNLVVRDYSGSGYNSNYVTTQVFRDPSAWYALTVRWDTTNATAANRCTIFINGVQITTFSTSSAPSQNLQSQWNVSGYLHSIGSFYNVASYYSGYITETTFVDGYVPTTTTRTVNGITETILTQLGEFSSSTGVWTPKAWDGTYGTNGFYLKFADNSNTTAATLGKDSSGNGNNWTPNNFSVTAGAGNDSLVDSPTSYGTDTGAGGEVSSNYATWNPLVLFPTTTYQSSITDGNLLMTKSGAGQGGAVTTIGATTGKFYAEATIVAVGSSVPRVGVAAIANPSSLNASNEFTPGDSNTSIAYLSNGSRRTNSTTTTSWGSTWTTNDVLGIAFDSDSGKVWFAKNGTWQASGDPAAGTNAAVTLTITGPFYFLSAAESSGSIALNAGQRLFAYTAPSGFKALCTQNLPTPNIGATSTTQANDYFNPVLYTGNGYPTSGTQSISGVGFQPDFVWIKYRSGTGSHSLYDAIRGATKGLFTNLTNAEETDTNSLTSLNSDGFSVGTNSTGLSNVNVNSGTYVAWNWNAGGSNATNTAGTITSTVRANTTSGFSIISYTGNKTSGATIGHGLGVAPAMVIFKERANVSEWIIYHQSLGATQSIYFSTAAANTNSIWFNNTAPSSTVITLGNSDGTNRANTMIAYAFAPVAGYSAFGSYTGNGSTDGPFVFTNMRPRFLLVKRTDSADDWVMYDSARDTYNQVVLDIRANSSAAEASASFDAFDFLSNGFKLRGTTYNASAGTYIYMALAENPFKYSLGR